MSEPLSQHQITSIPPKLTRGVKRGGKQAPVDRPPKLEVLDDDRPPPGMSFVKTMPSPPPVLKSGSSTLRPTIEKPKRAGPQLIGDVQFHVRSAQAANQREAKRAWNEAIAPMDEDPAPIKTIQATRMVTRSTLAAAGPGRPVDVKVPGNRPKRSRQGLDEEEEAALPSGMSIHNEQCSRCALRNDLCYGIPGRRCAVCSRLKKGCEKFDRKGKAPARPARVPKVDPSSVQLSPEMMRITDGEPTTVKAEGSKKVAGKSSGKSVGDQDRHSELAQMITRLEAKTRMSQARMKMADAELDMVMVELRELKEKLS